MQVFLFFQKQEQKSDYSALFFWVTFGHQQSQGSQSLWGYFLPKIKTSFLQKPNKRESSTAFVAINKRMIFHHEIKQMNCFFFNCWIQIFSAKRLQHIAQNSRQTATLPFDRKNFCRLLLGNQLLFELQNCTT